MPDPTKPKQGWFAGHLQTALPGVAADATAVRPKAKAAALSDYLRAARQATGGFVEGVTRLPADIASLSHAILPAPGSPSLQTTGRGSVRSSSAPTAGSLVRAPLDQAIAGNEHLAARLGDTVAGGAAENVSDESLRGIGEFAGNIAGFEGAVRLPKMAARLAQESRLLKALSSEGGATLTAPGEAFKGSGYAVADPGLTALVSSPTEMRAFLARPGVKKALAEGKHLGKWTDPATGRTEINITDILPSREKATALGMERGEKAIGDLKAGEYQGDVALEQVRRGAGPVMDAERAVGRDAAGNVITNRGRTVRDQAPLPRPNTVPDTRTPAPVGAYGTKPARPYTGQYSHQRVASPDALPGPGRPGNALGGRADDLQAELGYDHRPGPPAPVAAPEAPEKVVAAGYSTLKDPKTGKHFTGFNHADARDQAKAAGLREGFLESNSGFITNRGRFVNRKEAADLALKSGQMGPKGRGRTPLLSEHVKRGELASDRASRYEYTPEEAAATGLFSPEELRAMQPPIPGPWQPTPRGVSSGMAAEPRYLYHTTDKMNVGDIADAGLLPHKPSFRGEQNAWPRAMGGSGREGRVYFGQTEEGVSPFSEPGHTTLRVRRDYAEKTGLHEEFPGSDAFTRKTIPPEYIEVKQGDKWAPLKASRLGF